jgi:hypothetical protein
MDGKQEQALLVVNQALRADQPVKAHHGRQQILLAEIRRWALRHGKVVTDTPGLKALLDHLEALRGLVGKFAEARATTDSDESAYEMLRLDPEHQHLGDYAKFQEEIALGTTWAEFLALKTGADGESKALQRARVTLQENFRSLVKSNKRK